MSMIIASSRQSIQSRYALTVSVEPTVEPVTRAEARLWLRVDSDLTADDTLIDTLIASARREVEAYLFRRLVNSTWTLKLDRFPDLILVPYPPLSSVSSITYIDGNGDSQTLATTEYTVDTNSEPGRIYEAYGKTWPSTRVQPLAVTVTFVAGYGAAASNVPDPIKVAIRMVVARMYEFREPIASSGVQWMDETIHALLNPYKILEVA